MKKQARGADKGVRRGSVTEVADRKETAITLRRLNRRLQALRTCAQLIARATDEDVLLNEICRAIVDIGGYRMAWIGFPEHDAARSVRPVAQCGIENGYLEQARITWADTERGRGPTGHAIRSGQPCAIQDIAHDQRFAPWRDEAVRRGCASSAAVPLSEQGRVIGALNIYASEADAFDAEEMDLLTDLAGDLVFGLQALRVRTEHGRAEEAVRFSERKFAAAFRASPDAITITSTEDGRIIEINEAGCRLAGFERHELIGQSTNALGVWAEEAARNRYVTLLREHGRVVEMEAAFRTKSGALRPALVSGELIDIGGRSHILGIIRDVTDRVRAGEALKTGEKRYRDLVESVSDVIYAIDGDGVMTYVSPVVEGLFGYRPDELVGRDFTEVVLPEDRLILVSRLFDLRDGGATRHTDFRVICKSGEAKWVRTRTTPIVEDGVFLGVRGLLADIHDRKQAEERLQDALARMQTAVRTTIQVLVVTVETRDPYTAGHQLRTTSLATAIAVEMGLSEEVIEGLHQAAQVHDIGKISIPSELLSKPMTLSAIEADLVKTHAQQGYDILKDVESPWPLAEIVHQHHERVDGSGYPRGLRGRDILLEARILGVADTVEAMSSHRPYRSALGIEAALQEIERGAGVLYDPDVVRSCLKLFAERRFRFEAGPHDSGNLPFPS